MRSVRCWNLLFAILLGSSTTALAQHTWHVQVVDGGGAADVGRESSLVIDRFGALHVSYFDASNRALLYAYNDGTGWYRMVIEGHGAGNYSSLAVDEAGHPHVAYNSIYENGLHYAAFDGQKWSGTVIDRIPIQYYLSLQLDKSGLPHISYYYTIRPDGLYALNLKYAYFDGQQWFIQTVDGRYGTGKFNSIAVDSRGFPHVAYTNIETGDLDYAEWDGKEWKFGVADARSSHLSYVAWGNSIVVDSNDQPHIAHLDSTKKAVRYSYRSGQSWHSEVVAKLADFVGYDLDHVSLKLDSHGVPHVAFCDPGTQTLYYATRQSEGKWTIEVVDQGIGGLDPSLALDAQDRPYISYYDAERRALKLASVASVAAGGVNARRAGNAPESPIRGSSPDGSVLKTPAITGLPLGPNGNQAPKSRCGDIYSNVC